MAAAAHWLADALRWVSRGDRGNGLVELGERELLLLKLAVRDVMLHDGWDFGKGRCGEQGRRGLCPIRTRVGQVTISQLKLFFTFYSIACTTPKIPDYGVRLVPGGKYKIRETTVSGVCTCP